MFCILDNRTFKGFLKALYLKIMLLTIMFNIFEKFEL